MAEAGVDTVVIGIGNSYRRDDGVGPAVAALIAERDLPGVRVVTAFGEPTEIIDAWAGSSFAVLVDAAVTDPPTPGRLGRCAPGELSAQTVVSSHGLGIAQTLELGRALGRVPGRIVVYTVGAADVGHGPGLTPAVAAAVPETVAAVLAELANPAQNQAPEGDSIGGTARLRGPARERNIRPSTTSTG